jgi:HD-like signal output (HDOD) protein
MSDLIEQALDADEVLPWMPTLNISGIKSSVYGIKGNFVIPQMPKLILELDAMLNQKFPNIRAISNLIEENSVITGDILGLVNSATFQNQLGTPTEIRSIRQCLSLFGTERVYQMAVASAMKGISYDNPVIDKIISYSALIAKASAIISKHVPTVSVQASYLFGLFVHSGMIVLALQPNVNYSDMFELSVSASECAIEREEKAYGGSRHDYLGVAVARKWGLGMHPNNENLHREDTALLLAIQEHHNPNFYAIQNDFIRDLIAIGNLAQIFACRTINNVALTESQLTIKKQSIALLALDDKELKSIETNIQQSLFQS